MTKARAQAQERRVLRGEAAEEGRAGPCECRQGQKQWFANRRTNLCWPMGKRGCRSCVPQRNEFLHLSPFPLFQSSPTSRTRCNVCSASQTNLQRELTRLRGSPVCQPVDATAKDDDGSSVIPGLMNDAQAKRPRMALWGEGALDG